jgi:hypothetical protein
MESLPSQESERFEAKKRAPMLPAATVAELVNLLAGLVLFGPLLS